ncbi:hypothetical protein QMK52_20435 [Pseudomonas sp. P9_2]|uniref:hypothetical protein n=1 Tax=Pseudomonas TaxID=286 RepID=UPI0012FB57E4|nr:MULTISPECIES: hypothetical protein [Pseudomonas]WPN51252.1 hypothetical protein QMK52_20435 [Pseudomonas sp. P9_2]
MERVEIKAHEKGSYQSGGEKVALILAPLTVQMWEGLAPSHIDLFAVSLCVRSMADKFCNKNAIALGIESGRGYFGASQ